MLYCGLEESGDRLANAGAVSGRLRHAFRVRQGVPMKKMLMAALLCLACVGAQGADLQRLVQDTQRSAQEPGSVLLVWWIPTEYWAAVMQGNPGATPELIKQFEDALDSYLVVAVAAVDVGPMGGMTPRGRPKIEANTQLLIEGKPIAPLDEKDIGADARNFVAMMKPMMSNMLGQFGQGIEFLLYPNPPGKGLPKISAVDEGRFSYSAFGHAFDWRLPIGSLLDPKIDPATGEKFPGDYKFNPYTGSKLEGK
jgi:hypothetical protein